MRFLQYTSLCWLAALTGCREVYRHDLVATVERPDCIQHLHPRFTAQWYNASVDVVGKHISGLLLIKRMPDSTLRVVFTNEVGLTFFDFEMGPHGAFKKHQVIKQLDRGVVINLLHKDFELITMEGLGDHPAKTMRLGGENFLIYPGKNETDYFITDKDCGSLLRIEKASKHNLKTRVDRIDRDQVPDSVFLKHYTFDMTISLKQLHR